MMTFEKWKEAVDELLVEAVGFGSDDLVDCCYREWYDEGLEPRSIIGDVLRENDVPDDDIAAMGFEV